MAEYETVLVDKSDGVAWVSLNRPAVRNAISQKMQTELHELWHGFRYDDEVRCVVLAAEGDAFCTGIDRAEAVSDENNESMAAGDYPGLPDPMDVRRPRTGRRAEELRSLEAGHRRRARHGVRRRVLHARRDRVHHRGRRRHVLRPSCHLRHDRRVRADPDAQQDAVPRDHADVAAGCARADVAPSGPARSGS